MGPTWPLMSIVPVPEMSLPPVSAPGVISSTTPRANIMPALGPPTSDRPKVASTLLSTEIFRLSPSREPVVPSCGAIVVSAAATC